MSEAAGPHFGLTRLRRISARRVAHDWPWARENAAAIARNWQRRLAEKPGLFDGPVLLSRGCTIQADACEIAFFETSYAPFLAFRDAGLPDASVINAFAAVAPHTADGAVLLGQMGAHTANAGQIYFACGTPDRDDVRPDGSVDLAGSAVRELREETGLSLPPGTEAAPWVLVRGGGLMALLRPVRFAEGAQALLARFTAHREREAEPELARLVAVHGRADIDAERMPPFVQAYLDSVFAP